MFDDLEAGWLWTIGGILLLILEMLAPGVFLIFLGVAAIATGIFTLLFDLALPSQLALFVIYSVLAVLAGRRFYANKDEDSSDPFLNDRAARLIGKVVTVVEAVDDQGGRVRVGDSDWSARGGPAQPGERVRISGIDGNCLRVEVERSLPIT
jgi:inner membrane protein